MKTLNRLADIPLPQVFDLTGAPAFDPRFFGLGETLTLEKGAPLIRYGAYVDQIFYLHEGEALGFRITDTDMSLSYICKHGFLGEGQYFSKSSSTHECITATTCKITKFNEEAIKTLIADPTVLNCILFTMSTKLLSVYSKAENFKNTVKDRLRQFFLTQMAAAGAKGSVTIHLSQKEIAALLNVHPVSVSRALSELKKEMDIRTYKNRIVLP